MLKITKHLKAHPYFKFEVYAPNEKVSLGHEAMDGELVISLQAKGEDGRYRTVQLSNDLIERIIDLHTGAKL